MAGKKDKKKEKETAKKLDEKKSKKGDDMSLTELLSDYDVYLFNEGNHFKLYEKFGAHPTTVEGEEGTYFAVWAPDARRVSVMGNFNNWDKTSHPLEPRGSSGIWQGFIPGVRKGALYKYHIVSRFNDHTVDKTDPLSIFNEIPPKTASIVWDLDYEWNDGAWLEARSTHNSLNAPMSVYEVHLGSWRRVPEEGNRSLSYRELATQLTQYVKEMGFTHVEFLPIMDHPFFGSWGYQITGYFAPSGNFGTPQDLMYLIDQLHQNGIGVILDWVPSHFPKDEHGLGFFDGTHLYEHADQRKGFQPDWNSFIFNYGRNEIRSFLIGNAHYWLDRYHVDGLRVDAVASMLYLDYSRREGEWIPNEHGGRENLEAMAFLKRFNETVYQSHPDIQTIAEESTAWPMVSRPVYLGGLGFGMKWDMGWMHDTLAYMSQDPIYRKFHHNQLTFRMMYAFSENFMLPLSHDEVVYGKGSLIGKMPGDDWQKFANLRLLFAYMYGQPSKKLIFMGGEIAQRREWAHDGGIDFELLEFPLHQGLQNWMRYLNETYRREPALHELDCDASGFEWIDCNDAEYSTLTFMRKAKTSNSIVIVACNFTPVLRHNHKVGAPRGGKWIEILNSDSQDYGGSGQGNFGGVEAAPVPSHGQPYSVTLTLPPLAAVFLKSEG